MKTILIPVSNGFVARNFLRGGLAAHLAERGARLILLAPPEKRAYYESQFHFPHAVWGDLPTDSERRAKIWKFLEHASIPTRTVYLMHQFYLHRRGSQTPFLIRLAGFVWRMALWTLGHFHIYRALFRRVYFFTRDTTAAALLAAYTPDLVFCPTLIYGCEYALIKEARRRGIKTIAMPSSWDNFTSKTLLRAFPDRLLVQTDIMKKDVMRYGDYPAHTISVVGVPQYDGHFRREGILSRAEFFKRIGADTEKKLILFAFSGKTSMEADWEALTVLANAFQKGALSRADAQVLVRPYPKRKLSEKEYARVRDEFGFLIAPPVERVGSGKDAWEFDDRALAFLRNSIAHADLVITACSTFFVEAAIFGKPLVAIAFGPRGADYWNSARRLFEWNHLADLGRTGGVWRAASAAELIRAISEYLTNPALHADGRKRIAAEQAVFTDGKSLERIVAALSDISRLS